MAMRHRARTSRRALFALVICLVLAVWSPAAISQGEDIAVVVHPGVPVDNLTTAELRRILLGDREFWPSGDRVTLLIRAPIARERDVVVKNLCEMTEAQFRPHWIGKVFRAETPSGPKIVYSAEMARDQASRLAGAITFLPMSQVGSGLKVVRVDGRSPGQPGYRLK